MFSADPDKNYMAVSVNWGSSFVWGVLVIRALLLGIHFRAR